MTSPLYTLWLTNEQISLEIKPVSFGSLNKFGKVSTRYKRCTDRSLVPPSLLCLWRSQLRWMSSCANFPSVLPCLMFSCTYSSFLSVLLHMFILCLLPFPSTVSPSPPPPDLTTRSALSLVSKGWIIALGASVEGVSSPGNILTF